MHLCSLPFFVLFDVVLLEQFAAEKSGLAGVLGTGGATRRKWRVPAAPLRCGARGGSLARLRASLGIEQGMGDKGGEMRAQRLDLRLARSLLLSLLLFCVRLYHLVACYAPNCAQWQAHTDHSRSAQPQASARRSKKRAS